MLLSLQLALQAWEFDATSDEELVALYLTTRGDRYFGELYRRYSPKVYARSFSMLGSQAEANDAVQDVFEKVLMRIASFRRESSFSTWLYAVTRSHCIDRLRQRQRLLKRQGELPEEELLSIPEDPGDQDWLLVQTPDAIAYLLENLSELDRSVLVLRYMEELDVQAIAEVLDVKQSAAKMRLMRARQRAKSIYQHWRGELESVAA